MKYILSQKMKERQDQDNKACPLVIKSQNIEKEEPQDQTGIRNHPQEEVRVQEVVLELLEQEVEMTPAIQVEMMVQTGMRTQTLKKRMTVVLLPLG